MTRSCFLRIAFLLASGWVLGCDSPSSPSDDAGAETVLDGGPPVSNGDAGVPSDAGSQTSEDSGVHGLTDGGTDGLGDAGADGGAISPNDAGPPPLFQSVGSYTFDASGLSDIVTLQFSEPQTSIAVRVEIDADAQSETPCLQLQSVSVPESPPWLTDGSRAGDWGAYSKSGTQRAHVGFGTGLYVFPNNGQDLTGFTQLSMQIALRDCQIFFPKMPSSVEQETWVPSLSYVSFANAPLQPLPPLRLAFVVHVPQLIDALTEDEAPFLEAAFGELSNFFSPGGVQLELVASIEAATTDTTEIIFSSLDRQSLDTVYGASVDALTAHLPPDIPLTSVIPVHFVPCLKRESALNGGLSETDGTVPRIPGGFETKGHADGIFIRSFSCAPTPTLYWLNPTSLGKLIAHELGHFLGLYHSVESNGTTDHLNDTDDTNLMHYAPLQISSPTLSSSQFHVISNHPLLRTQ